MATEWPSTPLGKLVTPGRFISYGIVQPGPAVAGGVPIVRVADVREGRISTSDPLRVSPAVEARYSRTRLVGGELLLTLVGTVGESAIVPAELAGWNVARAIGVLPVRQDVGAHWVRIGLGAPATRQAIDSRLNTTVQATLNLRDVAELLIPMPPPSIRAAISHVISALDDKIALNRRMSEALEAAAQALFKSWFVDFDPVRAKAEGRDVPLPGALSNLFPSSWDTLTGLPASWSVARLGDVATAQLGGTPSRAMPSYWGGDIGWINSGEARAFRVVEPTEYISQEGFDSSSTKMLPARTTILAITGATLGEVSLTEIEVCANQSVVGIVGSVALPGEFLYLWIQANIGLLVAKQTGGAQQHINKGDVDDLPILCPPQLLMNAWLRLARPIFDRTRVACVESLTLRSLRDVLLTKLISGELRVPEAERIAVEAGA